MSTNQSLFGLILKLFPKEYAEDLGEEIVDLAVERSTGRPFGWLIEGTRLVAAAVGVASRHGVTGWTALSAFTTGAVVTLGALLGMRAIPQLVVGGALSRLTVMTALVLLLGGLVIASTNRPGGGGVAVVAVFLLSWGLWDPVRPFAEFFGYELRWLLPAILMVNFGIRSLPTDRAFGLLAGSIAVTSIFVLMWGPFGGIYRYSRGLVAWELKSLIILLLAGVLVSVLWAGSGWLFAAPLLSIAHVVLWSVFRDGGLFMELAGVLFLFGLFASIGHVTLARKTNRQPDSGIPT